MKIAVIGASGHLGSAVAREALARGHSVTAVSRDAERTRELADATAAVADILDPPSVARAVAGHDAVVASVKMDGEASRPFIRDAAQTLLDVLAQTGVGRLVFLGGGASLLDLTGTPISEAVWFPEEFQDEARDQADALELFRAADTPVQWSYGSPSVVFLNDGPDTRTWRAVVGDSLLVTEDGSASQITTGDYAAAILDALESGSFIRQRFTVGS
jgi:putative NADH-flavin reductase